MYWRIETLYGQHPEDTFHYPSSSLNHGYCGTFGEDLLVTDKPENVTCRRCSAKLEKMKRRENG